MVPLSYWTETHIQNACERANHEKERAETEKTTSDATNLFSTMPTASFKKAVYETPDLLEVAKHDGVKLTTTQQAMLSCQERQRFQRGLWLL
jgi:hypothetical protein